MRMIPEYSKYAITETGRVWSHRHKRFLKPCLSKGYYYLCLYQDNGERKFKLLHTLILETFVGPCPKGMGCRHLNGNKQDNRLCNLKWGTQKQNIQDSIRHGTKVNNKGERNVNAKLTEQDVRMIVYMYRTGEFIKSEISGIYQLSQGHIDKIMRKEKWKHIWTHWD